ncbi:WD repeat-containing protein 18 [Boothiomyces macroporosus]|uniref:WD repeat-containing protein 18 n=1 Tax=Boothiomyces macroporosus TaxID=261099 RepID=A0AAD5UES7_9FUNG|nr:WD repeat-containing protein 18 [Boothiomyces macroporosus]
MNNIEVAISCSNKENVIHCWDIRTGVLIASYKANLSSCVAIRKSYWLRAGLFLTPQLDKSTVNVYQFSKSPSLFKFIVPEKLTAMEISNSGEFCIGGGESGRIYIWEIETGRMIRMFDAHYKAVSCIKFTVDDMRLITGGKDSQVLVWSFNNLLDLTLPQDSIPTSISLSGHSLPITGLSISLLPYNHARVYSCSMDKSCKIWEITGENIGTVMFPRSLTAIAVNATETSVYCGAVDGTIYQSNLYSEKRASDYSTVTDVQDFDLHKFEKHTDIVHQLAFSMDESLLVSASEDGTCQVWDVASRQSVKTFSKKSPITTCTVILQPPELIEQELAPKDLKISQFSRFPNADLEMSHTVQIKKESADTLEKVAQDYFAPIELHNNEDEVADLKAQIAMLTNHNSQLRKLNDELYSSVLKSLK